MDLRSSLRFHVHCPVVLTAQDLRARGTVFNLSVWGCAVASTSRVPSGSRLVLHLVIPHQPTPLPVELARVRWTNGRKFGLEFLNMPRETRAQLRQFLLNLRTGPPLTRFGPFEQF